MELAMETEQQ